MPDRRHAPRYNFDGVIELRDVKSGKKVLSVASNLSESGCRVSTTTPFKKGAKVELAIRHGGTILKATGRVVYSTDHVGMGIRFSSVVDAGGQAILRDWAAQAGGSALLPASIAGISRLGRPRHILLVVLYMLAVTAVTVGLLAVLHRL